MSLSFLAFSFQSSTHQFRVMNNMQRHTRALFLQRPKSSWCAKGCLMCLWADGGWKSALVLPPTWRVIYDRDFPIVVQLPLQNLLLVWREPAAFKMVEHLQPLKQSPCRQAPEVWGQFAKLYMPGPQQDFM